MEIENAKNEEKERLQVSLRNSKNITEEMENKVNDMKNKENHLDFQTVEVKDRIQEEKNESSNLHDKNSNKDKQSKHSEKNINNENNKENEEKGNIENGKKEEKNDEEINEKKNGNNKNKIKGDNTLKSIEEKKNQSKKEQNKGEDGAYVSFKTAKNKDAVKNKEKDKEDKSYGTNYLHETPGGETPNGLTPGMNSQMKVSKEELIKISTEPVANYYSIIKDLGHGSYGQVKKVKHKKLNEIRAMKITNKKSTSSKYEIEILRKISHPNITNIFEIFADSKKYYVIMEFLEGGELFDAITSIGSFTEESACQVMKQLLSAIFYLHSNNIVHRDLKPENIMLLQKPENGNYHIKIIDFGTAKIFKPGKKMNKFIGTSYYIAPEVLKERYDEKCDIWSCGIILYILLCGYPPFNGNTNVEIFHAIQNQNPLFAGEEWDDITNEAKELIKLMLRKNPKMETIK
jgi:calcium-dependent protein kinase